jgi:hypothetical protein
MAVCKRFAGPGPLNSALGPVHVRTRRLVPSYILNSCTVVVPVLSAGWDAEHGIYKVYVGDGGDGHELLVTFDHKGVRIREIGSSLHSGDLVIKELPDKPGITLTI